MAFLYPRHLFLAFLLFSMECCPGLDNKVDYIYRMRVGSIVPAHHIEIWTCMEQIKIYRSCRFCPKNMRFPYLPPVFPHPSAHTSFGMARCSRVAQLVQRGFPGHRHCTPEQVCSREDECILTKMMCCSLTPTIQTHKRQRSTNFRLHTILQRSTSFSYSKF